MVQSKSGLWEDQALAGSLSARLRHARPPLMSGILSALDILYMDYSTCRKMLCIKATDFTTSWVFD